MRIFSSLPLPLFLRRSCLLLPFPERFRIFPRYIVPFWTVVKPVLFSGRLDIDLHPTSRYRTVSFASNHLPGRSFWSHYDAFRSNLHLLSFARELELVRAMLPLSALHVRALLPTSTNKLIGPSAPASFKRPLGTHTSCRFSLSIKDQCVPMRPFYAQVARGSDTSLLLQILSRVSTPELLEFASSTLFVVRDAIFQSKLLLPNTEWPW